MQNTFEQFFEVLLQLGKMPTLYQDETFFIFSQKGMLWTNE